MAQKTINMIRSAEIDSEKMIENAKNKADDILKEANKKANEIVRQSKVSAEEKQKNMLEASKKKSVLTAEQTIRDAKSEIQLLHSLAEKNEAKTISMLIKWLIDEKL